MVRFEYGQEMRCPGCVQKKIGGGGVFESNRVLTAQLSHAPCLYRAAGPRGTIEPTGDKERL